jgi:hypothetical protein
MKKEKNVKAAAGKKDAPVVPIGDPLVTQPRDERAVKTASIQPDWHRYADSRLKQFYCR